MQSKVISNGKKNISCQVTQELFDSIDSASHKLKMSKSEFMRSAIINKLKFVKNNDQRS